MILGTMQYMAPEQLEGKEADARTDIFAFGAVLYEMVTGRKAFEGKSQPHLIAAIISAQPDPISKTQPRVAAGARLPREAVPRKGSRAASADGDRSRVEAAVDCRRRHRGRRSRRALRVGAAGARMAQLALAAVDAAGRGDVGASHSMSPGSTTSPRDENRFLIDVPDMPVAEAVAISPDGRLVAYSARRRRHRRRVFVRPLDVEVGQKLAGTEGAGRLFWSPDSRWIAFFAGGRLKKVEAAGGPPQNICETPDLLGGTWNADGVIVFALEQRAAARAGGGRRSRRRSRPAADASQQPPREPYFLPDGNHYLYLAGSAQDRMPRSMPARSTRPTRRVVVAAQSNAVYAEPGYLLYHREGTLYAQAFDPSDLALSGEAGRVWPTGCRYGGRRRGRLRGVAHAACWSSGTIRSARRQRAARRAVAGSPSPSGRCAGSAGPARRTGGGAGRMGGRGSRRPTASGPRCIATKAMAGISGSSRPDNTTPSRFTFDAAQDNSSPVWSPDGSRIAFGSRRNGKWGLYIKLADNTRAEELLIESELPRCR